MSSELSMAKETIDKGSYRGNRGTATTITGIGTAWRAREPLIE
jgi:hypothetical protein